MRCFCEHFLEKRPRYIGTALCSSSSLLPDTRMMKLVMTSWFGNDMETLSTILALCERRTQVVSNAELSRVFFVVSLNKGWVNILVDDDLIPGHYSDVIMRAMVSHLISVSIVYSTVCPGANQRKHQSSASLSFVREFTYDRWISLTKCQ